MPSEPGHIDSDLIRTAIHQARDCARQIGDLQAANARTIRTLETALNQAIKGLQTSLQATFRTLSATLPSVHASKPIPSCAPSSSPALRP